MFRVRSYFGRWFLDIGGFFSNFYCIYLMYIFGQCYICLCVLFVYKFLMDSIRISLFFYRWNIIIFCYGQFIGVVNYKMCWLSLWVVLEKGVYWIDDWFGKVKLFSWSMGLGIQMVYLEGQG